MASHIIGAHDFENQKVINLLESIEINKQDGDVFHNKKLLDEVRKLILEIQELMDMIRIVNEDNKILKATVAKQPETTVESQPQISRFFLKYL